MKRFRGLVLGLAVVLVGGCAPYRHNDYYQEYYGGYPYSGSTYLSYYGGYPQYYWRPWYDYPWYWYDHPDHDDDDDDHHHRPPHHGGDREQAEYLLRNRTPAAQVRPDDLAPLRDDIARLPINMADRVPRIRNRRELLEGGFRPGVSGASRSAVRPRTGSRQRGDQWQR